MSGVFQRRGEDTQRPTHKERDVTINVGIGVMLI